MSSVVNELPIIHQVSVTPLGKLSRRNSTLIEEDDSSVKLLTDRFESSNWVYGNSKCSLKYLYKVQINLICF
jgi:hypothetical protein